MRDKLVNLFYGSFMHDIGKAIQRATGERKTHSKIGADYLAQFTDNKEILNQIRFHHADVLKNQQLDENDLVYITYIADNIASGTDRRIAPDVDEVSYLNWDSMTNLSDIFNMMTTKNSSSKNENIRYYKPVMLDDRDDIEFPLESKSKFSRGDYAGITERIRGTLESIDFTEEYMPSILNLFEATLSYVPSSTNQDEANDISLFDHSKLTAAIALCIYHYLDDKPDNSYIDLFKKSSNFYNENAFLLYSFDISGIQDFIYTINDTGAAKTLRSRSFYLNIFAENLAENIVNRTELSRANILYIGGGTAYLLLPNTNKTKGTVKNIEEEINSFLINQFASELFVSFGYSEFKATEIMNTVDDISIARIYQDASKMISRRKLNRYATDELLLLNQNGKKSGRECKVCLRVGNNPENEDVCSFCIGLQRFSSKIQKNENNANKETKDYFYLISSERTDLPLGFNQYLKAIEEKDIINVQSGRIYSKNKFYTGKNQARNLWVGYYSDGQLYDEYAKNAKGINRLAVVRCDVDDLGMAFINGFKGKYNTFSRSTSFSRNMSLFFNYHINKLMISNSISGTIIYSGGDDVFVLGEWQDMIKFSIELREDFKRFTNGKLTLSTGIGLFPGKTPVTIMAREAGKLEDAAKSNDNLSKDSISLFSNKYTYKWDHFIEEIYRTKLKLITDYFTQNIDDSQYGNSFIYNLISLIRESFNEAEHPETRGEFKTISWARWAYYISRMEPSKPEMKDDFKRFAAQLHKYFKNNKDIEELELALTLYIYSIRGAEE